MPDQQQQQKCQVSSKIQSFQPDKCYNNNIIFYIIYNTIYFQQWCLKQQNSFQCTKLYFLY